MPVLILWLSTEPGAHASGVKSRGPSTLSCRRELSVLLPPTANGLIIRRRGDGLPGRRYKWSLLRVLYGGSSLATWPWERAGVEAAD